MKIKIVTLYLLICIASFAQVYEIPMDGIYMAIHFSRNGQETTDFMMTQLVVDSSKNEVIFWFDSNEDLELEGSELTRFTATWENDYIAWENGPNDAAFYFVENNGETGYVLRQVGPESEIWMTFQWYKALSNGQQ